MTRDTTDDVLVPLADRVRGLQRARIGVGAAVVAAAAAGLGDTVARVLVLIVVWLLLASVSLLATRVRRSVALLLSSGALLLDGVFLAATTYAVVGPASLLGVVVVLHVVAVTLLASFRTGLKVATWHTLLVLTTGELVRADVLDVPWGHWRDTALLVVAVWAGALVTAAFAAVNEREIRRRTYDLMALSRLSLRLEGALRPSDVGQALVDAVCDDQDAPRAVLLGAVGDALERVAGRGDVPTDADGDPGRDVMVARAVAEHRTLRIPGLDPARDPWLCAALPGARNLVVVPVYADGAPAAVLVVEHGSAEGTRVARRVQAILEQYASHAGLALANARLLARMRRLADTDGLTEVANRRTFDAALADETVLAARQGRPLSLVMVDLDHFKRLNDTHGHQAGDAVLRAVGAALTHACRPSDLVARYGGEEFAVILPGAGPQDAARAAERLRAAVRTVTAVGPPGSVTASLGVACSAAGTTPGRELVAAADRALYRSKADGRDRATAVLADAVAGAPGGAPGGVPPGVTPLPTGR